MIACIRVLAAMALIFLFSNAGADAMSKSSPELALAWQWSAGRAPDTRILIEVGEITDEGSGLFGIKKSPSIAENIPEPTIVSGKVLLGPTELTGRDIVLRLPRPELGNTHVGDKIALGILGESICICAVKPPANSSENELLDWIRSFECN